MRAWVKTFQECLRERPSVTSNFGVGKESKTPPYPPPPKKEKIDFIR